MVRIAVPAVLALLGLAACQVEPPEPPLIDDPCGGPPGEVEASDAWLHAELVRRGHAVELVCAPLAPPTGPIADQIARMDLQAAMLRDRTELTGVMIERQAAAIEAEAAKAR